MRKVFISLVALIMLLSGCAQTDSRIQRNTVVAQNATSYFYARDDASFYILLDGSMKGSITQTELSSQLDAIVKLYGKVKEVDTEEPETADDGKVTSVKVPVRFTSGWMDFEYEINSDGSITSFRVVPSGKLDESGYNETKHTYAFDGYKENYVYTNPKAADDSTPLVILIHSKDAYDYNSTVGVNRVFRALAYQLADNQVASVRYDRTLVNNDIDDSVELMKDELTALVKSMRKDGILKDQPLYLFGYGVGGYLLPLTSAGLGANGYIIANAPSGPLADCLYAEQQFLIKADQSLTEDQRDTDLRQAEAALGIIKGLKSPDDYHYDLFGYDSSFWLSIADYDAVSAAGDLSGKLLVIAGSNDYEVSSGEYNGWAEGLASRRDTDFKFYKDMDHLFVVRSSASGPEDIYRDGTLSRAMIKDLGSFIAG